MVLQLISASGTRMTCFFQFCTEAVRDTVFVKLILIINERAIWQVWT